MLKCPGCRRSEYLYSARYQSSYTVLNGSGKPVQLAHLRFSGCDFCSLRSADPESAAKITAAKRSF